MGHGDFYWDTMMSKIGYGHLMGYNTMGFNMFQMKFHGRSPLVIKHGWEIGEHQPVWMGIRVKTWFVVDMM